MASTRSKKSAGPKSPKETPTTARQGGRDLPDARGSERVIDDQLYQRIAQILELARGQVARTVNTAMVHAYWHIGREIVAVTQEGEARARYGNEDRWGSIPRIGVWACSGNVPTALALVARERRRNEPRSSWRSDRSAHGRARHDNVATHAGRMQVIGGSMPNKGKKVTAARATHHVSDEIFKQVYDSPSSLPGKHSWVTRDEDVREIEKLLGMPARTIGAPLWVSGDTKQCKKCGRETNWLDIVSSGLARQHSAAMIAEVVLGERKFVNVEAPKAIADLQCFKCKTPILDLRSFKCHNWAYAVGAMRDVIEKLRRS